ncbi:MAG TPA: hypothetical protein VF490_02600 [Chryseosolibacter sp.]
MKTRHFLMGFTPVQNELSSVTGEYAYRKLSAQADIINHHFDNGVPWEESLSGTEYDSRIVADWTVRKERVRTGQKTYVSVTPINAARNGLAARRGSRDNMPLQAPWSNYSFNDEAVKTAYLNYCKRVIDFFHPDYFAMSVEANLLYLFKPAMWNDYLGLHEYIYRQLKAIYPDLPVFTTVAGGPMLEGYLKDNDHVQQRLAAMQVLEFSDDYALSFYPNPSAYGAEAHPVNVFDELFSISAKPLIVAETGYTGQKVPITAGTRLTAFQPDAVQQQKFVDDLLSASEKWKAEFVIWFTPAEYSQEVATLEPAALARREAGLADANGIPRTALNSWVDWFRRRVVE